VSQRQPSRGLAVTKSSLQVSYIHPTVIENPPNQFVPLLVPILPTPTVPSIMPASNDAAAAPSMAAPPAPTLPPVDYRGYPPPPYYDPYYDMRYDPYGPPPPRYSPEFRSRYAYPPPPRVSPRDMYRGAPGPRGPPHGQTPGQFRGPRRPSPTRDDASAGDKENLKSAGNGGAKRDSSGTPKAKDSETPKGGTMEHAVDNIIAAGAYVLPWNPVTSCFHC